MRRSTVLNLPVKLVFLAKAINAIPSWTNSFSKLRMIETADFERYLMTLSFPVVETCGIKIDCKEYCKDT